MYIRKTKDVYVLQVCYGDGYGWEDEIEEDSYKEIKQRIKEYRENTPYPVRYVKRREKINVDETEGAIEL